MSNDIKQFFEELSKTYSMQYIQNMNGHAPASGSDHTQGIQEALQHANEVILQLTMKLETLDNKVQTLLLEKQDNGY